ncbi:hypothetical protein BSLG_006887 [Batrachochytrium salamandrivorans]|nr:hypothetical protein BSLG_006887 [Batrachochytrium salamandrivorans]
MAMPENAYGLDNITGITRQVSLLEAQYDLDGDRSIPPLPTTGDTATPTPATNTEFPTKPTPPHPTAVRYSRSSRKLYAILICIEWHSKAFADETVPHELWNALFHITLVMAAAKDGRWLLLPPMLASASVSSIPSKDHQRSNDLNLTTSPLIQPSQVNFPVTGAEVEPTPTATHASEIAAISTTSRDELDLHITTQAQCCNDTLCSSGRPCSRTVAGALESIGTGTGPISGTMLATHISTPLSLARFVHILGAATPVLPGRWSDLHSGTEATTNTIHRQRVQDNLWTHSHVPMHASMVKKITFEPGLRGSLDPQSSLHGHAEIHGQPSIPIQQSTSPVADPIFYSLSALCAHLTEMEEHGAPHSSITQEYISMIRNNPTTEGLSWHRIPSTSLVLTLLLQACRQWVYHTPEWRGFGMSVDKAYTVVMYLLKMMETSQAVLRANGVRGEHHLMGHVGGVEEDMSDEDSHLRTDAVVERVVFPFSDTSGSSIELSDQGDNTADEDYASIQMIPLLAQVDPILSDVGHGLVETALMDTVDTGIDSNAISGPIAPLDDEVDLGETNTDVDVAVEDYASSLQASLCQYERASCRVALTLRDAVRVFPPTSTHGDMDEMLRQLSNIEFELLKPGGLEIAGWCGLKKSRSGMSLVGRWIQSKIYYVIVWQKSIR